MRSGIRLSLPERDLSAVPDGMADDRRVDIERALEMIMSARNIGPENARVVLLEACSSGKVHSRHMEAVVNECGEKMIRISAVPLAAWKSWPTINWPTINVNESSITAFDFGTLNHIGISTTDLLKWLSRPRRGPVAGKLSRFGESDRALFSEIERIMKEGSKSATEAARELDCEGKVNGRGTPESRVRRLAKLYQKEHPQRVR
jgi:hypothetical protein